jgi:hypothetical protein
MHLWLFMGIRPANGNGLAGAPVPPETYYLAKTSGPASEDGVDVRAIWSPVLFSLPSEIGFSRDLLQEKLSTRLTFKQPDETESFLAVDPAPRDVGMEVAPQELMLTAGKRSAPKPPHGMLQSVQDRPPPRRVYVAPKLMERLVGGIVLPPELNVQAEAAWEVHADMSISKQGTIRHVFIAKPMEDEPLNRAIIQLLYTLRFKAADEPVEGRIEIYSPDVSQSEGASP